MSMEEMQDNKQGAPMRDNFKVMLDWVEVIRNFPGDDFKMVVLALADFVCYGKEFNGSGANDSAKVAAGLIIPQAARMTVNYDKRAVSSPANGKKGGRPRKGTDSPGDDGSGDDGSGDDGSGDDGSGDDGEVPGAQETKQNLNNLTTKVGLLGSTTEKPNKTLREDKIREDNNKIKKDNPREEEGKKSAPIQSGADTSNPYSPSSLMRAFDFIDSSFSQPFSDWITYLTKKHKDRVPKTPDDYRNQYDLMTNLAKYKPNKACEVVDYCISKDWGKLCPIKEQRQRGGRDETIRRDVDNMLGKYGLSSKDVGI